MQRGAAIFEDACTACHLEEGHGQAGFFPPLSHNAVAQQADPTSVLHIILAGDRTAATSSRPTALTMPSFAWKLTDQQVADVATYIRNSWGNRAQPVSAKQVGEVRRKLGLLEEHGRSGPSARPVAWGDGAPGRVAWTPDGRIAGLPLQISLGQYAGPD